MALELTQVRFFLGDYRASLLASGNAGLSLRESKELCVSGTNDDRNGKTMGC